jgi:membrane-bound lytic murein transglycosylase A
VEYGSRGTDPRTRGVLVALVMALGAVGLPAAAQPEGEGGWAPEYRALAGWQADAHAEALPAVRRSCAYFRRVGPDRRLDYGDWTGTTAAWLAICEAADELDDPDDPTARRFFERWLVPVEVDHDPGSDGLFTGYYVTELRGAWERSDEFHVPIHTPPPRPEEGDLPSRAEIAAGALDGQGLELLWVDDPVDAFVTEIEGSGVVVMEDGSEVAIEYAGQNGHRYYAIGRALIEDGEATLDQVSMPFIRQWLSDHPDRAQELLNRNPSYVFFQQGEAGRGAIGAFDEPLTPLRSMAVDRRHVPLGIPLWIDIEAPDRPDGRIRRLVLAQDVGGGVKGRVRGDLFWGRGTEAEQAAGTMRAAGGYHMLMPRPAPLPEAERVAAPTETETETDPGIL